MQGQLVPYSLSVISLILEWNSVVGVATNNELECPGILSLKRWILFSPETAQHVSRAHTASYSMDNVVLFPGVKRSGHDFDHSPHRPPRLRMSGSIPLLPLLPSCLGHGQLYIFISLHKKEVGLLASQCCVCVCVCVCVALNLNHLIASQGISY
jgi:hypothetical protein